MNVLRASLVLALVSVSALASCGGGSSKEDAIATCKQGCTKGADLCAASVGIDPATFKSFCETACTSNTNNGATCKNASAIIAGYKQCQSKTTCDDYTACTGALPPCEGTGTGTGGASGGGTGGRSGGGTGGASGGGTGGASGGGAGGSSGTGACSDIQACCNASTNATVKSVCLMQYEMYKSMGDAVCAMYLPTLKQTICP